MSETPTTTTSQKSISISSLFDRLHCIGNFGTSCNSDDKNWRHSLEKPTKIHHNSSVSAVYANYDGFLWVLPRKVVRIRMNSQNSPYNAPGKKSLQAIHLQFVSQHASNLHCSAFGAPTLWGKGILSVLLPFVSQCSSHLYRNTPPICIAVLLGKSWWWRPPWCSPKRLAHGFFNNSRHLDLRCLLWPTGQVLWGLEYTNLTGWELALPSCKLQCMVASLAKSYHCSLGVVHGQGVGKASPKRCRSWVTIVVVVLFVKDLSEIQSNRSRGTLVGWKKSEGNRQTLSFLPELMKSASS